MARWAAHWVQQYLQLETRIVDDGYLPHAIQNVPYPGNIFTLKFSLFDFFPDADRIMYFDCDWRPVRPFALNDYCADFTKFYATPDRGSRSDEVANLAKSYGIDPAKYFNGGLFIAHKQHTALFQTCKKNYLQLPKKWDDQCVLNQIFKDHVTLLPEKLNLMDFGMVPAREVLGFHNGISLFIAAKKIPDYNWNADHSEEAVKRCSQQDIYTKLKALDYSHPWVTGCDHIIDIYQYAKDYAGQNALEVGSFRGHGAYALYLAGLNVRSCDPDRTHMAERQALCPGAAFVLATGEYELKAPAQYAVIFHDSYHGEQVVPELLEFWQKKLMPGGLLIVHDTDAFNMTNFLEKLGKPEYRNTFDAKKRGLGFFWKPR